MFLPPTLTRPRKGRGIAYGRNLRARSCPELHAPNGHNRSSCFDSGLFAIRFQGVAAAAERRVPPSLGSDSGFSKCDSPAVDRLQIGQPPESTGGRPISRRRWLLPRNSGGDGAIRL